VSVMGKLRIFDPLEVTFHHWVGIAESYFVLNNTAEEKKVNTAVQRLSAGPVKTWLSFAKSMTPADQASWGRFKETMAMVYDSGDHARVARNKIDSIAMKGSLEEYTQEFMSLLGDISTEYTISDPDQVHLFKKGLAPYLKGACTLNPGTGNDFQNLAALLQYAARYDAGVAADIKEQHMAAQKQPDALVVSPPVNVEPEVALAATTNLRRHAGSELVHVMRCYKCTGFGHKLAECPSKAYYDENGHKKRRG
jgi:Retrotransposon gag protein